MALATAAFWQNMEISKKTIKVLKAGGVGILPTDTLYGLVGSVLWEKAVKRIYKLKKRDPKKPMIILIGSLKDLGLFNIAIKSRAKKLIGHFWPGQVSIILQCPTDKKMSYLLRGNRTLAFRLPKPKWLKDLLGITGPLVAPSANPEDLPPAETIKEAKEYFRDEVDFYVNGGKLSGLPSTLIEIKDNKVIIRRQGAVRLIKK